MKDLLLITPPFTQLNTPYPATAYIKGFLNTKEISSFQIDLGIEVILSLFSRSGLENMFELVNDGDIKSDNGKRIFALRQSYISIIDEVIKFLQGRNQTLARQICSEYYLPQAKRFEQLLDMEYAFGDMGLQDKAKYLSTLFIEDLADFIKECIDPYFGFSRYAEKLGMSANSFDEISQTLNSPPTHIDIITIKILEQHIQKTKPKLVCLSVPFPGNLYSALKCGQYIKQNHPQIKVAMGGGFPNTELRSLKDERVFDYVDYISLDDGELPLELIVSNVLDPNTSNINYGFLKRTFIREDEKVIYNNYSLRKDYKQADLGTPDYSDLLLKDYISVIEIINPMHSLWSDGRWNKLTMAHGCYWGKCTFCDISLDYIKNYEPLTAELLVSRMEEIIKQTGERGFHFVDEAAPPSLMRSIAIEIIKRNLKVSWWTNIRFEKSFTHDLCKLLKASGCIAVSGGLEVASDRLLKLIDKGVTVKQVAQVCQNYTANGIMVHAYLMYGYPTQTIQETIDSLEMVRQMFELNIIKSGFWHQFAMTAHSPVGISPDQFKVTPQKKDITFADNEIAFEDSTGIDHSLFSFGLKKSLYNYMHGICFDFALEAWFDFEIPKTTVSNNYIEQCLENSFIPEVKSSTKIIWLGHCELSEEPKNGVLTFYTHNGQLDITFTKEEAIWLLNILPTMSPKSGGFITYGELKKSYEVNLDDFTMFWYNHMLGGLRDVGLAIL